MQMKNLRFRSLLFLAFGVCFRTSDAQESTETNANFSPTLLNSYSVEGATESISVAPENMFSTTVQTVETDPVQRDPEESEEIIEDLSPEETTLSKATAVQEPTMENTVYVDAEQTTPESVSETTATQTTLSTVTTFNVPTFHEETTVTEQQTTRQYKTFTGFTSAELTTSTDLIPTTVDGKTTTSLSTTLTAKLWTESQSITSDTPEISTEAQTTSWVSNRESDMIFNSTSFNNITVGVHVELSSIPGDTNWLLVILVCASSTCVLCVVIILIVRQVKKKTSGAFGPVHMNKPHKRSTKKGTVDDAWAGPVNIKAPAECDAEVQEGLLQHDEKQEGDDVVLSTFAVLNETGMSNGVGGEGTKEAEKWEAEEPMPYIDEDVDEDVPQKTLGEKERCERDDRSEELMNGGETFCLTTAV